MGFNKKFFTTGGIVASQPAAAAAFDPLQNFEIVTYTGNGGTQKITGYIRKGAAFNGSSSDIDLPSGVQSSTMAVSMFVFFTATPDTDVLIEFENGYGINFLSSDSGYVLAQYANSSGSNVKSNSAITTNQWYHIAANFTSSSAELYIDKVQQTGGTVSNYVTADQNTIGSRRADAFIPARIDQVRIFNTTLNSTQVGQLADEEYGDAKNSVTDFFGNGTGVALYQLDEDANDTGGTYNGTPTDVNFLGMPFTPDLVWVKSRSHATFHILQDSVRGAGSGQSLYSNSNVSEGTYDADGYISSLDTNGFTVAGGVQTNGGSRTYVAWCWKAGGAAVSGTGTNVTNVEVSANQDAGFSIVKYNYQSSSAATISHGLNEPPEMIILKVLDGTLDSSWFVYHSSLGASKEIYLNSASQATTDAGRWNNTSPTSSVFSIGTSFGSYPSYYHGNHIAYCFHSVDGYQKVGSYTGNGNASFGTSAVAQSITTGFQPRFVMIKIISEPDTWIMFDSERKNTSTTYSQFQTLFPNLPNAESNASSGGGYWHMVDFTSTGFDLGQDPSATVNKNGASYIYLAIA